MTAARLRTLQIGNDWFGERQGGLNRVYTELLKYLPQAGVEVRGLVVGGPQVESESLGVVSAFAPANAPLHQRLLAARRAGLDALRNEHYDLIVSHFALYALPLADRLLSAPTVVHFHGPWAAEAGVEGKNSIGLQVQAAVERAVYSRARLFIVLSEAYAEELVRRYQIGRHRIRLVPGGIDTARYNDSITRIEARRMLGWPVDRPTVLSVRRQVRRMGLENLIDAIQVVSKRIPEIQVMLAGVGPLMNELGERIKAHGLQHHIRQLGRVAEGDLPLAYRAADLSIVPTQALEGFGMITLESLSSGTPVLVTPVGGLPEVIRPLAPECVLEDTTKEGIAESLLSFLTGEQALPTSDACRQYALTRYDWSVIAAQTRCVYEEAIA